jgi:hypothetical protein
MKEERIAMKKIINCTAAASLALCMLVSGVYGGIADRPREGKQVVEKSRFMIDEGQKMTALENPTRAELAAQGQQMIKQGMDAQNSAKMMDSLDGRKNMQSVGQKLLQGGNLLFNMGKQNGELTQQEKEKIKKQGENLISFGKLMLKKGQIMGGN